MKEPKWLKHNVVSHVHSLLLSEHGGPTGPRDESLLQSALDRPKNKFGYEAGRSLHDIVAVQPIVMYLCQCYSVYRLPTNTHG